MSISVLWLATWIRKVAVASGSASIVRATKSTFTSECIHSTNIGEVASTASEGDYSIYKLCVTFFVA